MNPLLYEFKNATLVSYNNGSIIDLKNAKKDACVYYIHYGYVKEYTISDAGEEHILLFLRRHDVFPLVPFMNDKGGSQKIFFEALGRVKLYQLPRAQLAADLHSHLNIANAMLGQLCERFLTSSQHTENLLGKSASQKLVYSLLFLATRYGHKQGSTTFLDPVFTHKLIANTIGLTRGTVTKEFEKLRQQKLISTVHGRTSIINMAQLAKIYGEPFTIAQ